MQLAKLDPIFCAHSQMEVMMQLHEPNPLFARILRRVRRCLGLRLSALVATAILISPCSGGQISLSEVGKIDLPINARAIAWHPDSKTIAAGGFAGMLTVWDAQSGRLIRELKQTNGVVGAVEFSVDGKFLAVGKVAVRRGAYLTVFDAATYRVMEERESPNVVISKNSPGLDSISIDPKTSRKVAVLGYQHSWDPVIFPVGLSKREIIAIPPKPRNAVQEVAFNPIGEILAVGRINGLVDFYSSEDGRPLKSFMAYDNWVLRALVFSPDGKFVFTGSNTGSIRGHLDKATGMWHERINNEPIKMWDVHTLELIRTFDPEGGGVRSLAISPDGRHLYGGLGKSLVIWEVSSGAVLKRLDIAVGGLLVKASPNGRYLATTDQGTRVIKIWSVAN